MLEINKVYLGDCLNLMKQIPDNSINMINCDLPYGTTACSWDTIIPFEPLWKEYKRIIKDNGAIVLSASQPFTSKLISNNFDMFKYCWYWIKEQGTGFLNSKKQPLKNIEEICVFYTNQAIYNPQMIHGNPYTSKRGRNSDCYNKSNSVVTINNGERYPLQPLYFSRENNNIHPTQKPIKLYEYLIKTYTNKGDLVLDNCAGSGTTGIACMNLERNYILMEQEEKYYNIINKRIENHYPQLSLFES